TRAGKLIPAHRREIAMANRGPLTDQVVVEVLDVRDAAARLLTYLDEALADGKVTADEARQILRQARITHEEADEAYQVAEQTNDATLAAMSILRGAAVFPTDYTDRVLARGNVKV